MHQNEYTSDDMMFANYCCSHGRLSSQDALLLRGRMFAIRKYLTAGELQEGDEISLTDIYRERAGSKVSAKTKQIDRRAIRMWQEYTAYKQEYGI